MIDSDQIKRIITGLRPIVAEIEKERPGGRPGFWGSLAARSGLQRDQSEEKLKSICKEVAGQLAFFKGEDWCGCDFTGEGVCEACQLARRIKGILDD